MGSMCILSTKCYTCLPSTLRRVRILTNSNLLLSLAKTPSPQDTSVLSFSAKPLALREEKKGLFQRVKDFVGYEPIHMLKQQFHAALLYEKIVDNIDYKMFFKEFHMEDTFVSWFLIVELHVWMVSVRLMADVEMGKKLRNSVIEQLWNDVEIRMKKVGPMSSSQRKGETILLVEQFQAAMLGYDAGIMSDDRVLAGAVWRRFFNSDCDEPEHIEKLVSYIRKQIMIFDKMPTKEFLCSKKLKLENIKTFTYL